MPLEITSSSFLEELKRRRAAFSKGLSAVLKVPPELFYLYLQEHGTALRGDKPSQSYDIYPGPGKVWLTWLDKITGSRVFLKFVHDHPGIPPLHFIAQEKDEIVKDLATTIVIALLESGWDFESVRDAFLNIGMEQAKERLTQAIELRLKANPFGGGKLHGGSPAEAFKEGAYIVER